MTFSEYAKIFNPFFGNGEKEYEFIVSLTDNIISEADDVNNPLSEYQPEYCKKIYNGTEHISKAKATLILGQVDVLRFEAHINTATVDALQHICDEFAKRGFEMNLSNVGEKCADLLKTILTAIAGGKKEISNSDAKTALAVIQGSKSDTEFAAEITNKLETLTQNLHLDNALLVSLLNIQNGHCLYPGCGVDIGVEDGRLFTCNCSPVYLTQQPANAAYSDSCAVVFCRTHAAMAANLSAAEKADVLACKKRLEDALLLLDEASGVRISKDIMSVLLAVDKSRNEEDLPQTDMKHLVEIKDKIFESYLREMIQVRMRRLYKMVKEKCADLEQEIGFDTEKFGNQMKRLYETLRDGIKDKPHISNPQEHIHDLMVDRLYTLDGQRHKVACEIIIAYLTKRCDLFNNENAK